MKLSYEIVRIITLPDTSKEIILEVEAEQQIFLGTILETLEGYCYHTRIDIESEPEDYFFSKKGRKVFRVRKGMKITVTPSFFDDVISLLNDLRGQTL